MNDRARERVIREMCLARCIVGSIPIDLLVKAEALGIIIDEVDLTPKTHQTAAERNAAHG